MIDEIIANFPSWRQFVHCLTDVAAMLSIYWCGRWTGERNAAKKA